MGLTDRGGINLCETALGVATFDGFRGRTQDLSLTQDTAIGGAMNFTTGQVIMVIIRQDGFGGWVLTWPANFKGVPGINLAAFGVTTMLWAQDELGNFYPMGAAVWS